ncbi:hypothetical protein GP486_008285 [Trichoglossum hirsutum]|uniref:Uncharacterized protein n=1 Tax=Trichoglossum hirsutum TaxID=265104 RepID=A0A9P8IA63_9PEZI|nr:hypothetical protein GP486_008285 [Trichoglossum hirsutum]
MYPFVSGGLKTSRGTEVELLIRIDVVVWLVALLTTTTRVATVTGKGEADFQVNKDAFGNVMLQVPHVAEEAEELDCGGVVIVEAPEADVEEFDTAA